MTTVGAGLVLNIREKGSLFKDFGKKESTTTFNKANGSGTSSVFIKRVTGKSSTRVFSKALAVRSSLKKTRDLANLSTQKQNAKSSAIKTGSNVLTKKADPNPQKKVQSAGGNHTTGPPAKAPPNKSPSNIPKAPQQKNEKGLGEKKTAGTGGNSNISSPSGGKPNTPVQKSFGGGNAADKAASKPNSFQNKKPFQSQQPKQAKRDGAQHGGAPPMKRFRNDEQAEGPDSGQTAGNTHPHSKEGDQATAPPFPRQNREDNAFEDRRDGYTSSLFYGNPDIPAIPQTDVKPVSEKVFSEESFTTLDIAPQLVSTLEKLGFRSMTTVQQKSMPAILSGKDALVKSQTGSGKTLTYALPIINKLMSQTPQIQRSDGLLALVIVPTRELALQSYQWFEKLCKACVWVVPGYLIGGEKKKAEKARLRKGINILVATSGRLIDHIHHTKSLSLAKVKYLVIDEADRLLDMGYERSVTSIMESLKEQQESTDRQTIMLSATLSSGVEKLAGMSLVSPEIIDVSQEGQDGKLMCEALATPENLSHNYILVPAKLRLVTLAAFILSKCKVGDEKKMIVFFATQDLVDFHTEIFSRLLSRYGKVKDERPSLLKRAEKVLAGEEDKEEESEEEEEEDTEKTILFQKLHGSMTQQERSTVFRSFREASAGVLMCTDVASRGLDLPRVRWIVQFNAACTAADYVHRVGRTARVNSAGSAVAFLAPSEAPYIQMLEKHKILLQEIRMKEVLKSFSFACDDYNGEDQPSMRSVEELATNFQLSIENELVSDQTMHDMSRKAYVSFVRAYASYPKEVREMFSFKALHLGHYAKSMGLRDTPSALGASAAFKAKREFKEKRERKEKRKRIQVMNQKMGKLPKSAMFSEFDSGLDALPPAGGKGKQRR
ncbi:ATP-dependent DNA helicase DDX31 [Penaeus vannamei]|uniref:ATP-dependent DNA helicase DDX31 n=1 Tax=Penaeus vannamei TaxID=6689 RepID=UPI00387F8EBF